MSREIKEDKIKALLAQMTPEEKAAILSGKNEWQTWDIPRLGIPSLFCSDGPSGLRKQEGAGDHLGLNASVPATCFPSAATVANSWDETLCQEVGKALGEEAKSLDVNILLGPGLNIKRSPLGGRSFEYFSEDPYLSGKLAAAYIQGIQSQGVWACPKHFAVNSQETRRMASDSAVDERTLRELYLTGFEIAVQEGGAKTIMSSYNEINGVYANENKHLLKEILREEWGFDGLVITDWGASNNHVEGVKAGSDLEMPCPGFDSARQILAALEAGEITTEEVDACVERLLDAAFTLKERNAAEDIHPDREQMLEAHHRLARKAAAQSIVLLKNEDNILPLTAGSSVALIGDFALTPRYQGAGSSMVNPVQVEAMKDVMGNSQLVVKGIAQGYRRSGESDEQLLEEAKNLAKEADYVLFCFGLDELSESEGQDRQHLKLPRNQIEVLKALAVVNPNMIGILSAGAPVEMPWLSDCRGLLHGYLSGQAGASAMADIITGESCPCGKLNETYPLSLEDTPAGDAFPAMERKVLYKEALYVGYRYYDTADVPVAFPFGYGLSYTTFIYDQLVVSPEKVSFTVTNIGERAGAEIAQLYVSLRGGKVFRPEKELKGFAKVYLEPGETRRVEISLDDKAFRYWNVRTGCWEVEAGEYQILVGAGSRDIRLEGTLWKEGTTEMLPYEKERIPHYYSGQIKNAEDSEFAILMGHAEAAAKERELLTINSPVCDLANARNPVARLIYRYLEKKIGDSRKKGKPDLNLIFIYNMPFRAIAKMTEGMVCMEMAEGMVTAVNGHFFRGIGKVISGYFKNQKANKAYLQKLTKEAK